MAVVSEGSRAMALLPSSVWRNFLWCAIVERAMGALAVVLLTPGRECTGDVVQGAEPSER
jgi:hypothetical protein